MNKVNDLNKIFKALADKSRLRIVKMLQQKDLCVCEITAVLGLATSTVSNHLSILKNAGIIGDMKDGKWVEHHLVTETNNHFLNGLLPLLSFWLNGDEQVLADKEKINTVNREELCGR